MRYRKEFLTLATSIAVLGAIGVFATYCPQVDLPGDLQPVPSNADIERAQDSGDPDL